MVDYYETLERVMGGRAQTQDFARPFPVAGMAHRHGDASKAESFGPAARPQGRP
jgi:hypothetical protein